MSECTSSEAFSEVVASLLGVESERVRKETNLTNSGRKIHLSIRAQLVQSLGEVLHHIPLYLGRLFSGGEERESDLAN